MHQIHFFFCLTAAFAGMGFLSLYLAGKLHVFDRKGYTYKGFVVAAPIIVAILIAVSRTQDYRHHWHDVVAGSLVGNIYIYTHTFYFLKFLFSKKSLFTKIYLIF